MRCINLLNNPAPEREETWQMCWGGRETEKNNTQDVANEEKKCGPERIISC